MAKGGKHDSLLVEPPVLLYQEESVPVKGIGCVAIKDIKKGNLVLREVPQLLQADEEIIRDPNTSTMQKFLQIADGVMKSFLGMSREDQESYMKLHNNYDSKSWSAGMMLDYSFVMQATGQMTFPNISKDKAFKVWAIYKTNAFDNGVCLKMSRFNHSCRPNAQWFWNDDTSSQDLRALRKIRQGEEITLSYIPNMVSWAARRAKLKGSFNFDCSCEACDVTEAQIKEEAESFAAFGKEMARVGFLQIKTAANFSDPDLQNVLRREKAATLKRVYNLAKKMKTLSRRRILEEIVLRGLESNCEGLLGELYSKNRKDVKAAWMNEAKKFAVVGLDISKTLNGEEHTETKGWKERVADPIKFYLKKNNVIVKHVSKQL